jgi:hypothetical protein
MPVMPVMQVAQPAAPGSGLAIAGMVCGIVGAVFAFIPACDLFIAVPLGVIAIIMGAIGMKSPTHKGMGIAGVVLGIVAVGLSIGLYIWVYNAVHSITPIITN